MESVIDNGAITDVDACLGYLREEASLYKMMNDPNHRAMLFLLEVLMHSDRAIPLQDLALRFFSDSAVSADMQAVCAGSSGGGSSGGGSSVPSEGLRIFLEKYPSLFRVDRDLMVSSMDVVELDAGSGYHDREEDQEEEDREEETESRGRRLAPGGGGGMADRGGPRLRRGPTLDLCTETEAVKYFHTLLSRKDERWVPMKSLAGHLSQASEPIRRAVGSQTMFRTFLQRHPHVFETQGDLVSLRDQFPSMCLSRRVAPKSRPRSTLLATTKKMPWCSTSSSSSTSKAPPPPPPPPPSNPKRPVSMVLPPPPSSSSCSSDSPLAIDSREFQAAMFLRSVIRKRPGASLSVDHLFMYLARAPQNIRDCVGWTKVEMTEFLRKQPSLFEVTHHGHVTSLDTDEISVVVNDAPFGKKEGMRTIINHKGSVYHVSKLWGIIDLGDHEHVFFDKSIFRHLDDLQRHFKVGEHLYFNAILAPKQSRAKWRATQVWKESDKHMVQRFCGDILSAPYASTNDISYQDTDSVSCCRSLLSEQRHIIDSYHDVDEELAEILQLSKIESDDDESTNWENPITNYKSLDLDQFSITSRSPANGSPSSTEAMSSFSNLPRSNHDSYVPLSSNHNIQSKAVLVSMSDAASQTISTGEIMAVHMYHEEESRTPTR